ncbi:MAG: archaeosortase/exosortase family protein [Candidatus Omnitrophota bacterium]
MELLWSYFSKLDEYSRRRLLAWLLAGGVAVTLNYLGNFFGDKFYFVFAGPAAWMAGCFFNALPVMDEKGLLVIPLMHSSIQVTPDCSGYGFFCMMTAMFVIFYQDIKWRMPMVGKVLATLLMAYLITIVTNGFRIVSGYKIHLITLKILPVAAQGVIHLAVGITFFLTVFMIAYLVLERKAFHDRTST